MILAGIHWSTRLVTATLTELTDHSKIFSDTVSFANVKTAEQVVVPTTDGKKTIAGYKLVLRDKDGKDLYTISDSLAPPEARETLWQYLMRKHPMPNPPQSQDMPQWDRHCRLSGGSIKQHTML